MKHFRIFKTLALLGCFLPCGLLAQAPESVMVVEAYSGKILVAQNAAVKRPIASLTKIAMAAVAVDWATATGNDIGNVTITAPSTIQLVGGPNPMNLQPGETITLKDALYSALLGSDNLAALTIADHIGREILSRRGGSGDPVGAYVEEMNRLAKAVGTTNTQFNNPHGLDTGKKGSGYSTAADVVRLSAYAMRKNAITFIVRQKERQVVVNGLNGKRAYKVKNTNELIGEPGVSGLKTGTTSNAGPCVSICVDRDPVVRAKADGTKGVTPRRLIVVVLNNPDRFNRARGLIQQGWAAYDPWLAAGAPLQDRNREILPMTIPQ